MVDAGDLRWWPPSGGRGMRRWQSGSFFVSCYFVLISCYSRAPVISCLGEWWRLWSDLQDWAKRDILSSSLRSERSSHPAQTWDKANGRFWRVQDDGNQQRLMKAMISQVCRPTCGDGVRGPREAQYRLALVLFIPFEWRNSLHHFSFWCTWFILI